MQICTHCKNTNATIHVLDVSGEFKVDENRTICDACADKLGVFQTRPESVGQGSMLSKSLLENLIGGLSNPTDGTVTPTGNVCPGCGMPLTQFREQGRFGCPRCYDTFRNHVVPLLERVHDAVSHRGRCPGKPARTAPDPVNLTELRTKLQAAISEERYEEAAQLRDELRRLGGEA